MEKNERYEKKINFKNIKYYKYLLNINNFYYKLKEGSQLSHIWRQLLDRLTYFKWKISFSISSISKNNSSYLNLIIYVVSFYLLKYDVNFDTSNFWFYTFHSLEFKKEKEKLLTTSIQLGTK